MTVAIVLGEVDILIPMLFSLAKLSFSLENEFCRFMMFKAPVGAFFVPEYIKLYT